MAVCTRCGKSNPAGQRFCGSCGMKLSDTPSAPVSPVRAVKPDNTGLIAAIFLIMALIILVSTIWGLRIRQRAEEGQTSSVSSGTLEVGSRWQGTMQISNYKGSRVFPSDTIQVEGVFGQEASGKTFFELTQLNSSQKQVLMSFYVKLYPDHFVPEIGDEDNWVMDVLLDSSDVDALTVYLQNGTLQFSYAYDIGSVSCNLSVYLSN